jgi:hypothetical protein
VSQLPPGGQSQAGRVPWNPMTNAAYPQDYPRQGDDRHPHYYTVLRGDSFDFPTPENPNIIVKPGMGPPYEHCTS